MYLDWSQKVRFPTAFLFCPSNKTPSKRKKNTFDPPAILHYIVWSFIPCVDGLSARFYSHKWQMKKSKIVINTKRWTRHVFQFCTKSNFNGKDSFIASQSKQNHLHKTKKTSIHLILSSWGWVACWWKVMSVRVSGNSNFGPTNEDSSKTNSPTLHLPHISTNSLNASDRGEEELKITNDGYSSKQTNDTAIMLLLLHRWVQSNWKKS